MPVEILLDENDTINAIVSVPQVSVEIIATIKREGDTIWLGALHLERLTGGPVDRRNIELLCAELCRYYQADNLVIQGARRTTGRSAGSIPRTIRYKVRK
jgi:hypothetical protein